MQTEQVQTKFITITPLAAKAVKELMEERKLTRHALRVFISGKGCSGLQYGMALEDKIREQDLTGECEGINLVVDEVSIQYMQGAAIDFIDDETGKGFKIDNPNNFSCSCGDDSTGGCSSGGCQGH